MVHAWPMGILRGRTPQKKLQGMRLGGEDHPTAPEPPGLGGGAPQKCKLR